MELKAINFTDSSAKEYSEELLEYLKNFVEDFSTQAMSDHALFKQGQKDMLEQIISFIETNKP